MEKYKLIEKSLSEKEKFTVTIKADWNDGDYVTNEESFDKESFEEILSELINIKENYSGRHEFEEYQNEEDLMCIPYSYDGACHTLKDMNITYIDKNGIIYDVKI